MQYAAFALKGPSDLDSVVAMVNRVIAALGMTIANLPTCHRYPNEAGKGGLGLQYYQPISESSIKVETFENLGGLYLSVESCVPFDFTRLTRVVSAEHVVLDRAQWSLCLGD